MSPERSPTIPFVVKARRAGGVAMADALAAADAALDALAPGMRSRVDALADDLRSGMEAAGRGDASVLERLRRDADLLAGCAAYVGLTGLGRSAASLCRLLDADAAVPPSPTALRPFMDAVGLLAKGGPVGPETEAVLGGLEQIAALRTARP